jgi:hypothetical protein
VEHDILKKGRGVLREGCDMRFAFIARHRHVWPLEWMCSLLEVSRSGFHAWLTRAPSARALADAALTPVIERSFKAGDRTYGARCVWRDVGDNAAMESFFSSLEIERIRGRVCRSRDEARADVFDCIERFCAGWATTPSGVTRRHGGGARARGRRRRSCR